jgi:hypothetical protein
VAKENFKRIGDGPWKLTPVILASWEAEISSRPAQEKKFSRPHLNTKKRGIVAHTYPPS